MGFRIHETMDGTHELRDGPHASTAAGPQPCALRLTWGPERVRDWALPTSDRFLWQEAEGELRLGGLCDWTPCRGTLELDYLRGRIRYVLDLEIGGVPHRWTGEKVEIRPWNLPVSHTTCYATLTELASGRLVSTGVLRFRLRSLPRMLLSLRWR